MRAMREMQGKYVGNRPVRLKKSDWQNKSAFGGGKNNLLDNKLLGKR